MKSQFQRQLTEARRAQILQAALAVIADQGFQQTTIRQIAAQAEVADGTIYNYFKNKDDILMAIIAQISEAEVRGLHFAEAHTMDFADFVHGYVAHRMTEVDEGFPMLKVVVAETLANPALGKEIYDQIYTPGFVIAETYFRQLVADGDLPDLDVTMLTRLFAAPILGLLLLRMFGDEHVAQQWNGYSELLSRSLVKMFRSESVVQADRTSERSTTEGKKRKKKGKKTS